MPGRGGGLRYAATDPIRRPDLPGLPGVV